MNFIIREEQKKDWYEAEYMTKKAFWNLHVPGCDEHYLVHKLRTDSAFIPELSRVAEYDGKVIGAIYYSRSYVQGEDTKTELLTFGPLCVDPEYQNKGVGGALLEMTMQLAAKLGHKGIIIFGEPGYYPKHGFVTCDNFGITTAEGKNFDAFMGRELLPGAFEKVKGKFFEAEVFHDLPPAEVEEFDKGFPFMQKLKLPGQWA